jgi:hypothetical protein
MCGNSERFLPTSSFLLAIFPFVFFYTSRLLRFLSAFSFFPEGAVYSPPAQSSCLLIVAMQVAMLYLA